MKHGKRYLVMTDRLSKDNIPIILSLGCVRAETNIDAFYQGCKLLDEQTVSVVALAEIDAGWRY